jgi:hypothetical protein
MSLYYEIKVNDSVLINPFEFCADHCFQIAYYPSSSFLVIADNMQDALEEFGEYCKEKGFNGFISAEKEGDEDFPVNGGEFWLQTPDMFMKTDIPTFTYSITYQIVSPESAENGDFEETGFKVKDENGTLAEIAEICEKEGISEIEGAAWLYSIDPEHNIDFFEKGHEKTYSLHIKGQGYNDKHILEAIADYLK